MRRPRFQKIKLVPLLLLGWLSVFAGLTIFFVMLPDVNSLKGCLTTTMFEVHLCPGSQNYVRLADISKPMKHAVLVAEDFGFYSHEGFDLDSVEESLKTNLEHRRAVRGGSTITQQLVKNVYLSGEKTIMRKLREAVLTWRLEQVLKKDEIFERYLNVVKFGKDLFGVKAAARHYFHKAPSELNALESAFLAMLLPNPEQYSVSFKKGALTPYARKRVATLVRKLARKGTISTFQYIRAMAALDRFPWGGVDLGFPADTGDGNTDPSILPEIILESQSDDDAQPTDTDVETQELPGPADSPGAADAQR